MMACGMPAHHAPVPARAGNQGLSVDNAQRGASDWLREVLCAESLKEKCDGIRRLGGTVISKLEALPW
jgi:hypothetical protein